MVATVGKRVNIELKENVHTQAKILAALKKEALSEYLARAIEAAVKKDKKLLEELFK